LEPLANHIFSRKRLEWHIVFWIVATGYLMIAFRGRSDSYLTIFISTLWYLPAHMLVVYFSMYFLVPKLLFRKRYLLFVFLFLLVLLTCSFYVRCVDLIIFHTVEKFDDRRLLLRTLYGNLNLCGIALSIKLFKSWYLEREAKQQAEKAELRLQLQLLKSQVHPHFLFNTLNNLYSLSIEGSPQSPVVILKLSSLLRYMLYECNQAGILLEKEIEIIRNYIGLEQIRYGERLELSFHVSGELHGYFIAPLLLLPFVENAFKHGASKQIDHSWINIDVSVEENKLYFKLSNGVAANRENAAGNKGIGLANVKKRLALLYPGKHNLKILEGEETFTVSLQLELGSLPSLEQSA